MSLCPHMLWSFSLRYCFRGLIALLSADHDLSLGIDGPADVPSLVAGQIRCTLVVGGGKKVRQKYYDAMPLDLGQVGVSI